MNKRHLTCVVLLFVSASAFADDRVRSTQEELRRRNVYFGDVDGRTSQEFSEALRRYQSRKGLSPTGREDRETLRSLGLVARDPGEPVPKDLEWPEEPVLKSDARLDVVGTAQEISATNGVSLTSLLPADVASGPRGRHGERRRSRSGASDTLPSGAVASKSARFSAKPDGKLQAELSVYIRDYLNAVGRNRLEDELHFYADRVDYLGNGAVDRRIIEQSLRKYYQRWPKRHYATTGPISFHAIPGRGEIMVTFQTDFTLSNAKARVSGLIANQVIINAATADPRIIAITERRIRH